MNYYNYSINHFSRNRYCANLIINLKFIKSNSTTICINAIENVLVFNGHVRLSK